MRDLRSEGYPLAVDLTLLRAMHHGAAAGSGRLISGEVDRVVRIGCEGFQVMKNATTGRHAAGRDHDLGPATGGNCLGAFDVASIGGNIADRSAFVSIQTMIITVAVEEVRCVDCHRAVEIDRYSRKPACGLELPEMIKERLCAPDCKRRNNHGTATLYCALNNLAEHLGCIGVIVDAIAVSRFDDDIVGLRHGLGVGKHGIAIPAKVARKDNSAAAPLNVRSGCAEYVTRVTKRERRIAG